MAAFIIYGQRAGPVAPGADATRSVAVMANEHPGGDVADLRLIDETMRKPLFAAARDSPVALLRGGMGPEHATRFVVVHGLTKHVIGGFVEVLSSHVYTTIR